MAVTAKLIAKLPKRRLWVMRAYINVMSFIAIFSEGLAQRIVDRHMDSIAKWVADGVKVEVK